MSILTNLAVILLVVWLARFLWDVHQLVKKAITAIDRDQDILDTITDHEPEYLSLEEAEVIAVHVADMSREDALVAFIDAYDQRYSNDTN